MQNSWRDKTIALAGITQPVDMVDQLARTGYLNSKDFEVCIQSLFIQSPDKVIDVFGEVGNLRRGLDVLLRLLTEQRTLERGNQMLGYCLGISHLQKRLSKSPAMLDTISQRLEQARHQLEHFGPAHDNVIANLADLYTETVSTFPFRIQVAGDSQYLQQKRVANQVRVLLFAGIRASMLWRQIGGNRWQLFLHRKRIAGAARELLSECPRTVH